MHNNKGCLGRACLVASKVRALRGGGLPWACDKACLYWRMTLHDTAPRGTNSPGFPISKQEKLSLNRWTSLFSLLSG